jgi:glutathione S-transferase
MPFTYRKLVPEDPSAMSELAALWPLKKFPVLVEDKEVIVESSVIIEYLDIHHPGPEPLNPEHSRGALEVRCLTRPMAG